MLAFGCLKVLGKQLNIDNTRQYPGASHNCSWMYTDRSIWKLVKTEQIIEVLLLSKPQRRGHAAFSPSLRHGKITWNSLCREPKRRAMKESHKKSKQRKTTEWWLKIHAEHKRCTRLGWFCFVIFVGDWTWRDTVIWSKVIIIRLSEFQYLKRFGKTQTRCTCARRVDRQVWSSFQSAGVWILADSGFENDVQKTYWSTFRPYLGADDDGIPRASQFWTGFEPSKIEATPPNAAGPPNEMAEADERLAVALELVMSLEEA